MLRSLAMLSFLLSALCLPAWPASAPADPAPLIAAQKQGLAALAYLDGEWRGAAWYRDQTGKRYDMIHTERVGQMLDGAIKVIEGRSYGGGDFDPFNAFAIISFDGSRKAYGMRSYAMGRVGDFPLTLTEDGFTWTIPAGPKAVIRYTAVIKNGEWRETGDYVAEGQNAVPFFEMTLKRLGPSSWPDAGAVGPQ